MAAASLSVLLKSTDFIFNIGSRWPHRIDQSIGLVKRKHNFNVAAALPVEARTTSGAS
jgi:hypothetical protein